ncbi:MAG TPA: sorbosone dehydrogenase family protein [Steroidobacteraceae bacterium]|jgi:glucose/arabinose dehydrogenase|nr:sorbosone dehydrogenase family protein [Steroidobacteraceae bacterium]
MSDTIKALRVVCAGAMLLAAGAQAVRSQPAATEAEYGPSPHLSEPEKSLLPTVKTAKAIGWRPGGKPTAAAGTAVVAFVRGLDHPRWLYVLPNGDVLVAESDAPAKPDDAKGIAGKVHKLVMKHAGSGARPSANRITLLRDAHRDGTASERHVFLEGLNSPIGMALIGDGFYVADSDALLRFTYHTGDTEIRSEPTRVASLPAGTINHHWTKSLIASPDGRKLYVGVGSNSNAAENGLDVEAERSSIWEIDPKTGSHRIFASGLRNPVGLAWEPDSGALWAAVNERDELGDHLPPDYMTAVRDGAFYGWPFSYYGQHVDVRVKPQNPEMVAQAVLPDYALGAHTASLGLCWSADSQLPAQFRHGMFVGQHGSWNRKTRSGYKVVFVHFTDGKPTGLPIDVLTGFLDSKGRALGRPVGVAVDDRGALLVADDVGNTVWRVTGARAGLASARGAQ